MNCNECQENLVAYVEGLLDQQQGRDVRAHVQGCPTCRAEAAEIAGLRDRLTANGTSFTPGSVETVVMDRIARERASQLRKRAMRTKYGKTGWGLAAAAAVAAAFIIPWGGTNGGRATAAQVLARAIEGLSNLRSVRISANMRTLPRDNFELIGLDYPLLPIEMWKEYGDPPRWRVEKPGRVVVMDGQSSLLLIEPNHAARGGVNTGFVEWLKPLLDVDQVLEGELRLARAQGSDLELTHAEGEDGSRKLVVTVEAHAQGDFTNDWCKNKSISASDNRRIYRFDAETELLEHLEVWVHGDQQDVLVLDVTEIEYDAEIDESLFALDLPDDVVWFERPEVLPDNEAYAQMSPGEVARAFFEACAAEDWDEVLKFWATSSVEPRLRQYLGGLEIISIGEPFKSGRYPGWFVPYEIKITARGVTKKHNLAVRNDNPAKRYIVDGGI